MSIVTPRMRRFKASANRGRRDLMAAALKEAGRRAARAMAPPGRRR